jgi:glycosyltransferase involved in cell wall biosynthesis
VPADGYQNVIAMSDSMPAAPLRRRATLSGLEKLKVSAVLIVKNGERHLDRVLSAIGFCDEILVLDSGSTDRTLEICATHKVRVEHQPFLGYGLQKRRAVALAKHDWVLVIDDDEVLDYEGATTIQVLNYSDPTRAWRIRRRNYIGAREIRFSHWTPDYSVRLFNRTAAHFNDAAIHESVQPAGDVLTLQGSLHHYSYVDYADVFVRCAAYARAKAARYREQGRRTSSLQLVVRAGWGFVQSYIFKQGFRDGIAGVVVALSSALTSVLGLSMAQENDREAIDS